jgi:predicted DNA-binding transcriptional regulator YafY
MGRGATETLARQWLTLRALPRAPTRITATQIAHSLEKEGHPISKRSVERDLQALSLLFPIEADERSKPYGWSWQRNAPTFNLPGMSSLQAVVLLTAQAHLQNLLPANQIAELQPLFEQARRSIASVPAFDGHTTWPDKVALVAMSQPLIPPTVDQGILVTVHESVYMDRQLQLEYLARKRDETRHYTVHPLGLIQRGPVTYLVARFSETPKITLLAVHRIRKATRLDDAAIAPDGFTLETVLPEVAAGFGRGANIRLVLRMARDAAIHLSEAPLSVDQVIDTPAADGLIRVSASVEDTAQLRWWLLGFGAAITVVEPASLANEIRSIHRAAAEA